MNSPTDQPASSQGGASTALSLFEADGLPFPPLPGHLATQLRQQGRGWHATRDVLSTPYDLEHFLAEVETQAALADYAVVGFDGHGTNSWAVHCYLVTRPLALFIQMPWGGAYGDPEPERQEITAMFEWAAELQAGLERVVALDKVPPGVRLQVIASRFGRAGWRWGGSGYDASSTPWNEPAGMLDAMLAELDDIADGKRLLSP